MIINNTQIISYANFSVDYGHPFVIPKNNSTNVNSKDVVIIHDSHEAGFCKCYSDLLEN